MPNFKAHITKTVIDRLKTGDYVTDTNLHGFAARKQKHCVSYIVKASSDNRPKLFTIGKHGLPWTPETARKRAMEIKCDPFAAIKKTEKNPSVVEVAEQFKPDHINNLKPSTKSDYTRLFESKIIPYFKNTEVRAIKRIDCSKFHRSLSDTPRNANYALAVLSAFMTWCEEFGHRKENTNPCLRVKRFPEIKRERYLSSDEVKRLGNSLRRLEDKGDISIYAGGAIRLLLLTGARKNEILSLKHEYINFQQRIAYLPDSKTGSKKLKLNAPSLDVIKSLPQHLNNKYVIVGKRPGKHMVNISKPWALVCKEAKIENCRIHDLRHSYASFLASNRASLPMIGDLLGHSSPVTTQRYAHLTEQPVAQLNKETGAEISELMKK